MRNEKGNNHENFFSFLAKKDEQKIVVRDSRGLDTRFLVCPLSLVLYFAYFLRIGIRRRALTRLTFLAFFSYTILDTRVRGSCKMRHLGQMGSNGSTLERMQ